MTLQRLLIANRGEIAIRIARAAADLGLPAVAVYSRDDRGSLHARAADAAVELPGEGPAAYLDVQALVAAARAEGCDALHPGYGFLSESAELARACEAAGIVFVGPLPETLELFGDKSRARAAAVQAGVPVLDGGEGPASLKDAERFLREQGPGGAIMIKAVAGGGGRGMRPVRSLDALPGAFERCQAEALASFGSAEVYVERLLPGARHIEVQVVGDGSGAVSHLWERECSVQRQRQKLLEIAPAPALDEPVRRKLLGYALALAAQARYRNLGTFEFLVGSGARGKPDIRFIEANPRLQVEHTVTEAVTGVDLVVTQLRIAAGATLSDLGLTQDAIGAPRGCAIQARVNLETMGADGLVRPSSGTLASFEPPAGPGIRVDTFGRARYATNPRFDSLIAKVIAWSPSPQLDDAAGRLARALKEFRIAGVQTNLPFLRVLLAEPEFRAGKATTTFVDDNAQRLAQAATALAANTAAANAGEPVLRVAGAQVASDDPLAVLHYGKSIPAGVDALPPELSGVDEGDPYAVRTHLHGTVVQVAVAQGEEVRKGQLLLVIEAMKMQHEIVAPYAGTVMAVHAREGLAIAEDSSVLRLEPAEGEGGHHVGEEEELDLDRIRPDLQQVLDRRARTLDEARPEAVARRRQTGQRTARENLADLCDQGSFVEYGGLALPARMRTMSVDELLRVGPADGLVMGLARVNGTQFGDSGRCLVMSYDYTVFAGTQGRRNHVKMDRMLEQAAQWKLPVVLFAEGGGGRGSDTDTQGGGGLNVATFKALGHLSGMVPLVGVVSGRCFAGNVVLLGCCDVIIATRNATLGMGGPAMIEGGGLGVYRPEEVGPMSVQVPNGVVDVLVDDEAAAVAAARKYLSYFQGPLPTWEAADQRLLRHAVPENRLRAYDVRRVIDLLADSGSVLELRKGFGHGIVTSLVRIEGRAVGVIANNPNHLGGAIDSDAADKTARFMQLCDAFDIPILSLCDTPGNMVGPEHEKTALIRHCSRVFVIGANITVPMVVVVLRKAYGLGAMAMSAVSFHAPLLAVSWPTGEFGGMGLEGSVKLGRRAELAAIEDPVERKAVYDKHVAQLYEKGKALSNAAFFEVDDVVDPAQTRSIVARAFATVPPVQRSGKKHAWIDTW